MFLGFCSLISGALPTAGLKKAEAETSGAEAASEVVPPVQ